MNGYRFPKEIRELMIKALPEDTAVSGQTPDLRNTFTPTGHARALHPNAMLVVGMRGAGKSFWWTVLQSEEHKQLVAHWMPNSGITKNTKISVGFGERPSPDDYPGKDTLVDLISRFDPRQVWRTIVLRQIIKDSPSGQPWKEKKWSDAVTWLTDHPEEVERMFYQADQELERERDYHLILFDALDRTADDWPTMLKIMRGLLQVLLEFRSYRRIRPKAFVRPDHLEDAKIADFPDSSKVLSQKVELRWPRNELYGLLWQYLSNEPPNKDNEPPNKDNEPPNKDNEPPNKDNEPPNGELFREGCRQIVDISWEQYNGVWMVPERLKKDEEAQRKVFHAITGPWMGRDRRRGFPYTWLPNHLGDAGGQVSPRSFLAALHSAASDTLREGYEYALYYESIKKGVQKASQIRVREMQEDYPWVGILMEPLSGLTVPCHFEEISRRWEDSAILTSLKRKIAEQKPKQKEEQQPEENKLVKLPPVHLEEGADGVRKDLETLGVFERMSDNRVNMPDVYRVGFGLGRRGGVKAVARE